MRIVPATRAIPYEAGPGAPQTAWTAARIGAVVFLVATAVAVVGLLGATAWVLRSRRIAPRSAAPVGIVAAISQGTSGSAAPPEPDLAATPAPPLASAAAPPELDAQPNDHPDGRPAPTRSQTKRLSPAPRPEPGGAGREPVGPEAGARRLTTSELDAALRPSFPALRQCVAAAGAAPPVVRVRVAIAASGTATYEHAMPSPPAGVAACFRQVLAGVRVSSSTVEPTTHLISISTAPGSPSSPASGDLWSSPFESP